MNDRDFSGCDGNKSGKHGPVHAVVVLGVRRAKGDFKVSNIDLKDVIDHEIELKCANCGEVVQLLRCEALL